MWRKQIQRLAAQGWDHGLLLPSEWLVIAIKLDEFGLPCCACGVLVTVLGTSS